MMKRNAHDFFDKIMSFLSYKRLPAIFCVSGTAAIVYGMLRDNDIIFIIGLPLVICGYLMIRKKLKESLKEKASD